jgi:hypothetical protein
MTVRCTCREAAEGTVAGLRGFARSLGVSVHDVLLALLARTLREVVPQKPRFWGNSDLGLGSIVDARGDAQVDLDGMLGVFLGYFVVRSREDRAATLADEVQRIASQTRLVKSGKRYLDSMAGMRLLRLVWSLTRKPNRPDLLRKVLPFAAGITNIVCRDTWLAEQGRGEILGYRRIAPTGPMLPLVIAPTTRGDAMNVSFTYRVANFSDDQIGRLVEVLMDQIESCGRQ